MGEVSFEEMREIYYQCFLKLRKKVDSFEQIKLNYVPRYLQDTPELESQICYDDSPCTDQIVYFRNRLSDFRKKALECQYHKGAERLLEEIRMLEEVVDKFEILKKCQARKNANSLGFDSSFDQDDDFYDMDESQSLFKDIIIKITLLEMQMPLEPLTDPETCRDICHDLYHEVVNGHYEGNKELTLTKE